MALNLGMVCYAAQTNWYILEQLYFSKKIEKAKGGVGKEEEPFRMGLLGCRVFIFKICSFKFFLCYFDCT